MNALADLRPEGLAGGRRAWALLAALGISVGGFVAGLLFLAPTRLVANAAGAVGTDWFAVLSSHHIQVGFAAFGIVYLHRSDDPLRYVDLRWPTRVDLAWILVLPFAFVAITRLLQPVLLAAGLAHPMPTGGDHGVELLARPDLWPVALVGLYLFAAPAEELVYRGIVQGRLRGEFGVHGVALGGAVAFGLMHALVGLLTPGVALPGTVYWGVDAFAAGVVLGYAYEHTRNLTVTAVTHAMHWTIPLAALLGLS